MELANRLIHATAILAALHAIGFVMFVLARAFIFSGRVSGTQNIPWYWAWAVILYPAIVVYGFVINVALGIVLLGPIIVFAVLPELFMVNYKTDPAVRLPDTVKLTAPVRKVGNKYRTKVRIDGEDWTAEMDMVGDSPPTLGQEVSVVGRSGTTIFLSSS